MIPQFGTLHLSRPRLANNIALLRSLLGPACDVSVVVKADAYGHGARGMVSQLAALGLSTVCTYNLTEAQELIGLIPRIIVLAPIAFDPRQPPAFTPPHPSVTLTLNDLKTVLALRQILPPHAALSVQVQIDTGLTRGGALPDAAAAIVDAILETPALKLFGLFGHLSHGSVPRHPTIDQQAQRLLDFALPYRARVPDLRIHHQNSGGAKNFPAGSFDLARVGIAALGLQKDIAGLQPIARVTAPILAIHDRPAGTGVGYSHLFSTSRPSRLAILPVGFGDGYPRILTHTGVVSFGTRICPVVGRVSMDQLVVDITDTPLVLGDSATVISDRPADPHSIDAIARHCNTINYEIATGFGARLQRRWHDDW